MILFILWGQVSGLPRYLINIVHNIMPFSVLKIHGNGSQISMLRMKKRSKFFNKSNIKSSLPQINRNLCKVCKVPVMYASRYHWICDLDIKSFGVMGSQCRLNCWEGKYGVHNTTVLCKGNDMWMVNFGIQNIFTFYCFHIKDLKTGDILSGREVDNLGWDCPKKTTTTSTTTTTTTSTGCDKEAFESDSNANLTCTSSRVGIKIIRTQNFNFAFEGSIA